MRVLVVYASHYGSTRGIAEKIAETLRARELQVDLRSVDEDLSAFDDQAYDAYVIGSAIHASHWLKPAIEFVRDHAAVLARRPAWLFSSGPIGEKYVDLQQPDPKEIDEIRRLLDVKDHVVFAGSFDPATADMSKAGWLDRQVTRFIPVGDFRDWDKIEAWATYVSRELEAVPV